MGSLNSTIQYKRGKCCLKIDIQKHDLLSYSHMNWKLNEFTIRKFIFNITLCVMKTSQIYNIYRMPAVKENERK